MSGKGLKSAIPRPSARASLVAANVVAQEAGLPPASLLPIAIRRTQEPEINEESYLIQVNIRVRRALGDQLADRAQTEGTTQKVLLCRALAGAGFDVHPDDLKATPLPRRRGRLAPSE